MPMYDYLCEANGHTVEVVHGMSTRLETWGEVCEHARLELGDTPADAPVKRLIGGGSAINSPVAPSKVSKAWGDKSKSIHSGPMAAPMRTKNW
ncbi:MAG: zinc ribbon domain-containing protein [Gammaproteobacteria bacterium]